NRHWHQGAGHPIDRTWLAFARRAAFGDASAGGTVSGRALIPTKHLESYRPQLPAASRAGIHTQVVPGADVRPSCHVTFSTAPSKPPSEADIGIPCPVAPAGGWATWRKSSAAAIADPPCVRSSAVAEKVTKRAAPGGSGAIRTLPAHRTGPSTSPLGCSLV